MNDAAEWSPRTACGFCSVFGVHFGLVFGFRSGFGLHFGPVSAWLLCGYKDLESRFSDFP